MDPDEDELNPAICLTFGHGRLRPEAAENFQCKFFSKKIGSSEIVKAIAVNSEGDVYVGEPDNSNLCQNLVAVRNKNTNSVRFYRQLRFFMNSYLKPVEKKSDSTKTTQSVSESLRELNQIFGSKKTKRSLTLSEKSNAKMPKFDESSEQVVDNVGENKVESHSPAVTLDYIPPCNRYATEVEEAYKLNDVISEDILDSLDSITKEIMEMDLISLASDSRFSPFLMKAISHVPKDFSKFRLLVFIDQLLAFSKVKPHLLSNKTHSFCTFSTAVHKKLVQDFTIPVLGGKRQITRIMLDKILCHALILLLICCGYELDIDLLAGSVTRTEHKRIPDLLRILGAYPKRKMLNIYQLKVPLGDPPVYNKSARNSKKAAKS